MSRKSTNVLAHASSHDKVVLAAAATLLLLIGGVLSVFAVGMVALRMVLWISGAGRGIDEGLTW